MESKLYAKKIAAAGLAIGILFAGCSRTTYNRDFNGLTTTEGTPIAHVHSTRAGFHLLMGWIPLFGNASLSRTLYDFTKNAKELGGSKINITTSEQTNWWFSFFPFTMLLTPVSSTITGDVME